MKIKKLNAHLRYSKIFGWLKKHFREACYTVTGCSDLLLTNHSRRTPDWKKLVSITTLPQHTKAIGTLTSRRVHNKLHF